MASTHGKPAPKVRVAKWLAAIASSVLASVTAVHAADLSDLWWVESESGWGANVAHQGDILFLTFFVYDRDGRPVWYVGPSTQYQATSPAGKAVYSGTLYETTGPWLGGPFDPNLVTVRPVGTVSFTENATGGAAISYVVNGTTVTKTVTRTTFRLNPSVSGSFVGAWVGTATGCTANGKFEIPGVLTLTQAGTAAEMFFQFAQGSCSISGTYAQAGRLGRISGTISCTSGARGNLVIQDIEANTSGFTARYSGDYGSGCTESGRLAGARE